MNRIQKKTARKRKQKQRQSIKQHGMYHDKETNRWFPRVILLFKPDSALVVGQYKCTEDSKRPIPEALPEPARRTA